METIDKEKVIVEIKELYNDIDKCISELIVARGNRDGNGISNAHWRMETLMVNTQQAICNVIDTFEVKEVDLPSNVDEAAEIAAAVEFYVSPQWREAGESLFKAGAEWMAGQGVTIEKNVGQIEGIINNHTIYHNGFEVSEIDAPILNSKEVGYGDKVIVQVRKKGE